MVFVWKLRDYIQRRQCTTFSALGEWVIRLGQRSPTGQWRQRLIDADWLALCEWLPQQTQGRQWGLRRDFTLGTRSISSLCLLDFRFRALRNWMKYRFSCSLQIWECGTHGEISVNSQFGAQLGNRYYRGMIFRLSTEYWYRKNATMVLPCRYINGDFTKYRVATIESVGADIPTARLHLDCICRLTHCGLVTPYGGRDLGQHWLR